METAMRKRMTMGVLGLALVSMLWPAGLPLANADDLKQLDVPVFRDRKGFGLAVTEYGIDTQA